MHISSQVANIYQSQSRTSQTTSQALFGERVFVIEQTAQWSKVRLENDNYTGYIENRQLSSANTCNTHQVINRSTPLFDSADIKSPVHETLLFGSELQLELSEHDQFMRTSQGQYIWKAHTQALQTTSQESSIQGIAITSSLVETAESLFMGAPYLWGGRSPLGLDCSALVQLSTMLHGWRIPRDTKDQEPWLLHQPFTTQVDYEARQKDDLVFWPGHVAIMRDSTTLTHATAHSLQCCVEELAAVEQRAGKPSSLLRLNKSTKQAD